MTTKNRMQTLVNTRIQVTLPDARKITGRLIAFDKYMNLVISESEELRKYRKKEESSEKRILGLVVLRGDEIVSIIPASAPLGSTEDICNARIPASFHIRHLNK